MTLASSGALSSAAIKTELGLGGSPLVIPSTAVRNLTGRVSPNNIIWPTHFYGQTGGGLCSEGTTGGDVGSTNCIITNLSFGATAWNRRIFACCHWCCDVDAVDTLLSSATIGGVAAAVHIHRADNGTSSFTNYGCAIISATVPTGATGTVHLVFNNATIRSGYATTYRVTGLISAVASDTGFGFDETVGGGTAATSADLNVPQNGLAFFAATASCDGTIGNMSTTGITERQEQAASPLGRISNGFTMGLSSQAGRPVDTNCTVSVTGRLRLVTASFQLA